MPTRVLLLEGRAGSVAVSYPPTEFKMGLGDFPGQEEDKDSSGRRETNVSLASAL